MRGGEVMSQRHQVQDNEKIYDHTTKPRPARNTPENKYARDENNQLTFGCFTYGEYPSWATDFTNNTRIGNYVKTFSNQFDSIDNPQNYITNSWEKQHTKARYSPDGCKIKSVIENHVEIESVLNSELSDNDTKIGRRQADAANILTVFLTKAQEHGVSLGEDTYKFRFNVGELRNGRKVYLEYPGKKSVEHNEPWGPFLLDFAVKIEGWENQNGSETPQHSEIFSDIYWKVKESVLLTNEIDALTNLKKAIELIYYGWYPSEVTDLVNEETFNYGNQIQPMLHALYWIMLQEDFNYPRGSGRSMCWKVLNQLLDLRENDLTHEHGVFPKNISMTSVPEYEHSLTQEGVHGFESSGDRGELVPEDDVVQQEFGSEYTRRKKWGPSTVVRTHGD